MNIIRYVLGITLVSACWTSSVEAHHLWLNATRYTLEQVEEKGKAKTVVYFGWGDYFPVHDFLREGQIKQLKWRTPSGHDLEVPVGAGGFSATPLELTENGPYVVSASMDPQFIADVWKDGQMQVLRQPKDALPKDVHILESKYGVQFAKAIIQVGSQAGDYATPLGHELEIIPLADPRTLQEGDYLPFKIMFKGQELRAPLADPVVQATYGGFSTQKDAFASTVELDRTGRCRLKLIRYGVWQIFVRYVLEPTPELVGKADKIEYKASLTFEVL